MHVTQSLIKAHSYYFIIGRHPASEVKCFNIVGERKRHCSDCR